jgi:hypothetical protein
MRRSLLCLFLVLSTAGCKDLFSAHANVAAEAAGQTLTTDSLAALLAQAKGARLTPETAEFLANLWVDYQLFGNGLATGMIKTDSATVVEVMWPEITEAVGTRWHEQLMASRTAFTPAALDSVYASTDSSAVRVMQHVLIKVDPNAAPAARTAAERKAQGLLSRIRGGANFAQVATQNTDDQASRATGGVMNAAPRGAYVTPFDSAGWTLRSGEVSGIVVSPFGYHIIRRPPLAEVRGQIEQYLQFMAGRQLDSLYMDSLGTAKHLEVKSGAAGMVRTALENVEDHRTSGKPLSTYDGGKFTVRDLLRWTGSMPQDFTAQLKAATDSQISGFVRALTQNVLLLEDAKEHGVGLDAQEYAYLQMSYSAGLDTLRHVIGLTAEVVDTSATASDRERAAAATVNAYVGKLLARQAAARAIPGPLTSFLRDRLSYKVNMAGVSRAVELAMTRRDSVQAQTPAGQALPGGPAMAPQVQGGTR